MMGMCNFRSGEWRIGRVSIAAAFLILAHFVALSQVFQQLHQFVGAVNGAGDGSSPRGALIQGKDGNFYGTTIDGGTYTNTWRYWGLGTVFRITPQGVLTIVASFNGTNGMYPIGALVQASDGNFYGATEFGANYHSSGGLFRMTPEGVLTAFTMFFDVDGSDPIGDLVEGADRKLYGITAYGGNGYGTIFRIAPDGNRPAVETLFKFVYADPAGWSPSGGLLLAKDGNFYGVTSGGGPGGRGTVFKMTPNGTLTTMASFYQGPGNAVDPYGKLVQADDGNFYGVAGGGTLGTIFRMTPSGVLTILADVDGYAGATPVGGLVQGRDGKLYGTAYEGGTGYGGTVFVTTLKGDVKPVVALARGYDEFPHAGLVQGSDGNLYGVGGESIFRLIMPGPSLTMKRASGQAVLSWRTNYPGFTLQYATSLNSTNWADSTNLPAIVGAQYVATNTVSGGNCFYRIRR